MYNEGVGLLSLFFDFFILLLSWVLLRRDEGQTDIQNSMYTIRDHCINNHNNNKAQESSSFTGVE